jgi:hypothetical protein
MVRHRPTFDRPDVPEAVNDKPVKLSEEHQAFRQASNNQTRTIRRRIVGCAIGSDALTLPAPTPSKLGIVFAAPFET